MCMQCVICICEYCRQHGLLNISSQLDHEPDDVTLGYVISK